MYLGALKDDVNVRILNYLAHIRQSQQRLAGNHCQAWWGVMERGIRRKAMCEECQVQEASARTALVTPLGRRANGPL